MLIATDAHDPVRRPPVLAEACEIAGKWVGQQEALNMVSVRPSGVTTDTPPEALPAALFRNAEIRSGRPAPVGWKAFWPKWRKRA
jgi:hypothetical protein